MRAVTDSTDSLPSVEVLPINPASASTPWSSSPVVGVVAAGMAVSVGWCGEYVHGVAYRSLGLTGMHVSSLCLGAMMFGRFGNADHDECVAIINRALDAGVNFIDTADIYSAGESEEIVAKALAGGRRDTCHPRHEVPLPCGQRSVRSEPGPEHLRQQPAPYHPRLRGQSAAPRHRLDRPLPDAPAGLHD